MKQKSSAKGVAFLSVAALIWGTAFVAQSTGMDYVGPFTFNAIRSFIGCIFLIPCIMFLDVFYKRRPSLLGTAVTKQQQKTLIKGGVICGLILSIASALQQVGLVYTSVGKTGFITTLYIIIVPIFSIFLGKKAGIKVWVGVILASVGLYMLCINESFTINIGDVLVAACAVAYSFHILTIAHYSPKTDGLRMSCIQFLVVGIVNSIPMFLFESPQIANIINASGSILYAGILSSGIAYTLQIIGQRYTAPTIASLIMSFESVIAVLAGWIILGEILSQKEIFGCVLVFVAIIIAQLPKRQKN